MLTYQGYQVFVGKPTPLFLLSPVSEFFFFNFLFYIGIQWINNVVLVSGVQQSDSVIHIHVPILVHTAIFKMDNQQGPTVQQRELCSMLCGSLDGRGVWGRMDTCVCMAESLCCASEAVTTLLIGYIPIQNKKLKKIKCY